MQRTEFVLIVLSKKRYYIDLFLTKQLPIKFNSRLKNKIPLAISKIDTLTIKQ